MPLCAEYPVPVFRSAAEQLAYARKMKLQRQHASAEGREHWGLRAADAYRSLPCSFPNARALGAEARFRSGRILLAMGREEAALSDFFWVATQASSFAPRARMEVAHVHRRRKQWERALEIYTSVAGDQNASGELHASAWLYAGDMYLQEGLLEAAKQAWSVVANGNFDRRKRVLAFDRMARMELDRGGVQRLSEIFLECLQALGEVVLEESDEGRRVRRALTRTQLVKTLALHPKRPP